MAKILSIYITSDITYICKVSKAAKYINLYNAFQIETPKDSVEDGTIIDAPALAAAIRNALPEKIGKKLRLYFTVSSRKIANKEIIIPYIKNNKKITEIITVNAPDYFPMSNINDYIYDYTILEVMQEEERKQYRLAAVAVQKDMIKSYYELAAELKMPLEAIDYYGNSVFQMLKQQVADRNTLVLQMEKEMTHVSIMAGKAQVFRRTIPFGKNTIVQVLAEMKQITEEEAENILSEEELIEEKLTKEEYIEAIRDIVSAVIRIVEFHTSRNQNMIMEEAKLFGEGRTIAGLDTILKQEMNVPVEVPKQLEGVNIKIKEGFDQGSEIDFLPNLGVILDPLNLKIEEKKQQENGNLRLFIIAFAGCAAISTALTTVTLLNYQTLKEEKISIENAILEISEIEEILNNYEQTKIQYDAVKTYYGMTESPSEKLYQMLIDMEKIMPESVGISQLQVRGKDVDITCTSAGKPPAAMLIMELKKIDYITNIYFKDIAEIDDEEGNKVSVFHMIFELSNMPEETMEPTGQEPVEQEAAEQEPVEQEAAEQEPAEQEAEGQEPVEQETAEQEAEGQGDENEAE